MIDADRNMPRSDGRGRETLGQRAVCLCLRAWHWMQMSKPPSCADVHADPPIKSLTHRKVTRGVGLSCLHSPRPHEEWFVNSRRFVVKQASRTTVGRARTGCRGGGWFPHQQEGPVVIPVEASFVGESEDF